MVAQEMPRAGISQVQLTGLLALSLIGVVLAPNVATGLVGFAFWLFVVSRAVNWREAVVAALVLACVLASSRESGLQYWKTLRLVPAALAGLEALRIFRRADQAFKRRQIGWLATIVLCTGLPALLSEDAQSGLFETALLGILWVVLMILGTHRSPEDGRHRGVMLLTLGIAVLAASVVVSIMKPEVAFLNARWRGVFGNPNELSHWWLFLFLLALFQFQNNRRMTMVWLGVTAVVYLFSGTRGALLGASLAWFGSVGKTLFDAKGGAGIMVVGLMAVAGLFVLTPSQTGSPLLEVLPDQLARSETLETGGGRTIAWAHAWEEVKSEPWFGRGGGYEERYFSSRYSFFAMQNHQGLSHNSWLAFGMNYGIPGALVLIFSALLRLNVIHKASRWVFLPAALVSLTVEGWLTAPLSAISPLLFLVGGHLGHALSRGEED